MNQTIDTERLKASIDLIALAERYSTLHRHSGREMAGPCPLPRCTAKTDGFHVHADGWWKCYTCHPKPADVIEFVMLVRGISFREACEWLGAGEFPAPQPVRRAERKPESDEWKAAAWQRSAYQQWDLAVQRLAAPQAGEEGRVYLVSRSIQPETWHAWKLGFTPAADSPDERKRPAIIIPWTWTRQYPLCALQYRYTEDTKPKYYATKHSSKRLFGLHMRVPGAHTLLMLEGELNAMSAWQALRNWEIAGVDVVSFGSDGAATSEYAVGLAAKYSRVIVWADKAKSAAAAAVAAGGKAHALRSIYQDGQKLDANALLQSGILEEVLAEALAGYGVEIPPAPPTGDLADWRWHADRYHGGHLAEWVQRADGSRYCGLCYPYPGAIPAHPQLANATNSTPKKEAEPEQVAA